MRIAIGDHPADLARLMLAVERGQAIEPVDQYQVRTPSLDDVYFVLTGHDHAGQSGLTTLEAAR